MIDLSRSRWSVVVGAVVAVLLASSLLALAQHHNSRGSLLKASVTDAGKSESVADPPSYDWSRAFGGAGQPFATADQARQHVAFTIRTPQRFTPSDIEVAPSGFAIGWSFDLPQFGGWVHVVESKASTNAQAFADQYKSANVVSPKFTQTNIDHGALPAVLASANDMGRMLWSDGAINYDVAGEALPLAQVAPLVQQMFYP
jgi:hypothetical protein